MNMYTEIANIDRPKITFALFSYNQEQYIREAVEGAFSQTYAPLEFIFSDDCSGDRTYEIMEAMVAGYEGPQQIILNRNTSNLGWGEHVNRVMGMASGELIVMAAGDDISEPSRADELVSAWLAAARPPAVGSSYIEIDEGGATMNPAPDWVAENACRLETCSLADVTSAFRDQKPITIPGCIAAWSAKIWEHFGDLGCDVVCEDEVLSLRSALLGGAAFVPRPLIRYRRHSQNIWSTQDRGFKRAAKRYIEHEQKLAYQKGLRVASFSSMGSDIDKAMENELADRHDLHILKNEVMFQEKKAQIGSEWWDYSFSKKLKNMWAVRETGMAQSLLKLMPLSCYAAVRARCATAIHGEGA